MLSVLCFGNEFIKEDSLAKELADSIGSTKKARFIRCDSPEDILKYADAKTVVIMDVVNGIKDVIKIRDINQLEANKLVSLHDFDLGFFLKLMKKMGKIKSVEIIGIPQDGDKEEIKKQVVGMLGLKM